MKEHTYKGFTLKRNGRPKTPWNVYNQYGKWIGYGTTMANCKVDIDYGCYEDERNSRY